MTYLKNSLFFAAILFISVSCTTHNSPNEFSIEIFPDKSQNLNTITVSADHIQQKCVFLNAEAENKWRHQYMMYILDDKNEVIPIVHVVNQDKATCEDQIKKIKKILNKADQVKICVRDKFEKDNSSPEEIDFGKLGKHSTEYSYLWFQSICNNKDCYSYDVFTNICPGFPRQPL